MCTLKEGEDAFTKIGQALDLTNNRNTGSGILGVHGPPNPGHSNTTNHDHPASTFDITTVHALSPKTNNSSDADLQLPSELISSCVSTLLMIQVIFVGVYLLFILSTENNWPFKWLGFFFTFEGLRGSDTSSITLLNKLLGYFIR